MTTVLESTVPDSFVGRGILAIPSAKDIFELAAARFPDARWAVDPQEARVRSTPVRGSGGARFRGMQAEVEVVHPELALEPGLVITGPFRCTARDSQALGLLGVEHDLFVFPEAQLTAHIGELRAWALVAAKHSWGALVEPDGEVLRPDPEENIALRLFSPDPQPLEVVMEKVRQALPSGQIRENDSGEHAIVAPLEYDGSVLLRASRAATAAPAALKAVDWRDYGPHVYAVEWLPPADLATGEPAPLYVIARQRAGLVIARAMTLLQKTLTGTVLDDDDVIVTEDALAHRVLGRRTV